MEVVLDGIIPSSFGATSWSFPAMNVWIEVIDPSHRIGRMACGGYARTNVGGYNKRIYLTILHLRNRGRLTENFGSRYRHPKYRRR